MPTRQNLGLDFPAPDQEEPVRSHASSLDIKPVPRLQRSWLLLFHMIVLLTCLLAFVQAADHNYRSSEGFLGWTSPPYQREIMDGTAPAPYVYRQAIPRLRAGLEIFMLPGHAALLADTVFAVIAVLAGVWLAGYGFGPSMRFLGIIVATLACIAVFPNDKPEAVAAVAITTTIAAFSLAGRFGPAALLTGAGILVRADISILFAIAFALGFAAVGYAAEKRISYLAWVFAGIAVLGLLYLQLARFVLWPESRYPTGVPFFMGYRNLLSPLAWPGLVLGLSFAVFGVFQALQTFRLRDRLTSRDSRSGVVVFSMGMFTLLYAMAVVFAGKAEEIRLYQPLVPLVVLTGLRVTSEYRSPGLEGTA